MAIFPIGMTVVGLVLNGVTGLQNGCDTLQSVPEVLRLVCREGYAAGFFSQLVQNFSPALRIQKRGQHWCGKVRQVGVDANGKDQNIMSLCRFNYLRQRNMTEII